MSKKIKTLIERMEKAHIVIKTVGDLKKAIEDFPDNTPIVVSAFVDCKPFDGEGTDMSGMEDHGITSLEVGGGDLPESWIIVANIEQLRY